MKHILRPLINTGSTIDKDINIKPGIENLSSGLVEAEILTFILPEFKINTVMKKREELANLMKSLVHFFGNKQT